MTTELQKVEDAFKTPLSRSSVSTRSTSIRLMGTTTIKSFRFSPSGFTTACPRRQVPHTCGLTSVCPEVFLGPTIPRMQLASLSAIPREIYDGVIKDYPNPHLILNHSPNQSSTSTLPCLFIAPPHRHQLAPPWTMRRIWLTRVASGQLLPYAIPKLTSAGYKLVAGMSLHVPPPPGGQVGYPYEYVGEPGT